MTQFLQDDEACKAFGKFRELCPDVADAYLREGVCLAKKGDLAGAHKSFQGCLEKSTRDSERPTAETVARTSGPACSTYASTSSASSPMVCASR